MVVERAIDEYFSRLREFSPGTLALTRHAAVPVRHHLNTLYNPVYTLPKDVPMLIVALNYSLAYALISGSGLGWISTLSLQGVGIK